MASVAAFHFVAFSRTMLRYSGSEAFDITRTNVQPGPPPNCSGEAERTCGSRA